MYGGHHDQRWGPSSYSQHGEDLVFLCVLERIHRAKTYMDLGAHHPINISNTKLLYDRGWRGWNIEANLKAIREFDRLRPEDHNICVGVAPVSGQMCFYMFDETSGRNTFSAAEKHKFLKEQPFRSATIEMREVRTLSYLVETYCNSVWPTFLSMDVEGLDFPILETTPFNSLGGPALICVEVHESQYMDFKSLMRRKGYSALVRMHENMIFIASQYEHLVR